VFYLGLIMKTVNLSISRAVTGRCVPYTPTAVSYALVRVQALAQHLAASNGDYANLNRTQFDCVAIKRDELLIKSRECAQAIETLLHESTVNMATMFNRLASMHMLEGKVLEETSILKDRPQDTYQRDKVRKLEGFLQTDLTQVQVLAAGVGLNRADYYVDGVVQAEQLLNACMSRIEDLRQRLENNDREVISLLVQVQKDTLLGAVASSLQTICEWGLDNQITIDPTPLAQENVLLAMSSCMDFPFSGAWPVTVSMQQQVTKANGKEDGKADGGAQ
jgi:hypothetical protein